MVEAVTDSKIVHKAFFIAEIAISIVFVGEAGAFELSALYACLNGQLRCNTNANQDRQA